MNLNETLTYQRVFPFNPVLIDRLIKIYGTPLQLYDIDAMKANAINFIETFSNHLPGFKQFFAVKALPNPYILKTLCALGMGLDCSSETELLLAHKIGVCGENIMFTSNYTSLNDLKLAMKIGATINLDDSSLINDLYSICETMPTKLFFRFNPGIGRTDSETVSNVLGGPDAKFGMDSDTIIKGIKQSALLGTQEFGIHVMTGSNVTNINYWSELIDKIFELLYQIKISGYEIQFINLGGGIGIDYKTGVPIDTKSLCKIIMERLVFNSTKYNVILPIIYMENGRFITGPYGYLLAKCNVVKELYGKTFYGLDACMSNLMRPGMYNSYHHISIHQKYSFLKPSNVVGTLCENNDWFAKDRLLPTAEPGNIFIIWDTGAHSHSMGFQYNGKLRAPEIAISDQNFIQIRRRETFDDYISTVIDTTLL
jgi:diaminopimelate decarboxylase